MAADTEQPPGSISSSSSSMSLYQAPMDSLLISKRMIPKVPRFVVPIDDVTVPAWQRSAINTELVVGRIAMIAAMLLLVKEIFTGESFLDQCADILVRLG
jgi:hypothetical protein